jgi:hypothetical protein
MGAVVGAASCAATFHRVLHSLLRLHLALGDEVEIDANFVLQDVVRRSGQTTLRVWFGALDEAIQEALMREIEAMKPLMVFRKSTCTWRIW